MPSQPEPSEPGPPAAESGAAQRAALTAIMDAAERGEPVTSYADLAAAAGLRPRRIGALIARLEEAGLIEVRRTAAGRVRTHTIRPAGRQPTRTVPVLGRVAAGVPILADQGAIEEFISLPAARARGSEVYMLQVKGESMTGDGILDGDHVVVATDPRPPQAAIAVVLIGEEATVKHVYYEKAALRLRSSNPGYPDLVYGPADAPVIQGRVIGVVRWLQR
ncbi:MAG TPA: S24 family peptidase [Trebonia sp.]|jgi:repressor LexA|nr:S24 family peptidase [Trebonia sp.]